MSARRSARHRGARRLGIMIVILGLVHTPLPQPDFHNIRHHDGAGEVCEHHDHLIQWHPGAGIASDVAVLHWHWFLPSPPGTDPSPPGSGLAVHARTGLPCPVCGDTIREVSFHDSNFQYCPGCQTGGKPLADRRLSKLIR